MTATAWTAEDSNSGGEPTKEDVTEEAEGGGGGGGGGAEEGETKAGRTGREGGGRTEWLRRMKRVMW